jgi:hypothetical protein
MQTATTTLDELQAKIESIQAQSAIQNVTTERELEILKAQARCAAHIAFHHQYGEWDWIVRQQYMDLVKSLAYDWPMPNGSLGYAFELNNYTPWVCDEITGPDFVVTSDCIKPYDVRSLTFTGLTEFIKPENIDKCKLTPKILAAFKTLKYLEREPLQGRGFGISRKVMMWKDGQPCDPDDGTVPDGFDYDGYKFHLR